MQCHGMVTVHRNLPSRFIKLNLQSHGSLTVHMEDDEFPKDKKELYNALRLSRFYLPKIDSTVCTKEWLEKVALKQTWCPGFHEIKLLPCVEEPLKKVVMLELQIAIDKFALDFPLSSRSQPDVKWALDILSSCEPDHRWFQKDYVLTPEESRYSRKSTK